MPNIGLLGQSPFLGLNIPQQSLQTSKVFTDLVKLFELLECNVSMRSCQIEREVLIIAPHCLQLNRAHSLQCLLSFFESFEVLKARRIQCLSSFFESFESKKEHWQHDGQILNSFVLPSASNHHAV